LFVKDYLGLSAEFLAGLGFWAGIPGALKMHGGNMVELLRRFKPVLVWPGSALFNASPCILIGRPTYADTMRWIIPVNAW